ncbi:Uncharacterized protein SCF082_LOCUS8216 [Durusdinium trenchii]|uniref:Uncharacterized protein n=1 Tax=Durusdinium trenchii TaxID=1381693 RepID=A0ABP0ISR2_9DINO
MSQDSLVFEKYVARIACDFGIPLCSEEDKRAVWEALPEMLTSFVNKGSLPKSGRWFSFHDVGLEQMREWWATRMVLGVYLDCEEAINPDSLENFKALRKSAGGLKLGYMCTSQNFWEDSKIILTCAQPLYTFFCQRVRDCKTADDSLEFSVKASKEWRGMPHLSKLADFLTSLGLAEIQPIAFWSSDVRQMAQKVFSYLTSLLGHCSGSLSRYGTLPDSKLIEDTHGRIRMRQKSQSNEKLTRPAVQLIVNDSGTLEEREIRHGPAVTEDAFLQLWRETKDTYKANERCNPKTHKLPKFFGKIMKRERSWAVISEPNLRCSADGLLNLLCKKGNLIQKCGLVFLILQNHKWASLAWPVVWVGENLLQVKPGAEVEWIFVYNPDDWEAIPFTVARRADLGFGLCFQRSGPIERLVRFALRSPGNFVLNDFHVLCDHYGIPNGSSQKTRFGALQLLAFRFGRNDEDYVKEVLEAEGKGKSSACKRNENQSDFMECLLENMNLEERVNFKDLKQEVSSAERYSFAKRQLWNEWNKEKKAEIEEAEPDAHDSEMVAPPVLAIADEVAEASMIVPGSPAAGSHESEQEDLRPADSSAPPEVHEHSQERMSLPQVSESEPRLQEADNLHPTAAEESQVEEGGPTAAGSSRDKPKASSPVRAPVVRVHRSPAEILNQLSPPGMMLRMTYNDHRFKVEIGSRFHESSSKLKAPYSQKSYSKSFASGAPTWQEALSDVHNHAWTKHNLMVIAGYMVGASNPQSPGVIPEEVLSDLQPEIEKMPPPKKYG